MYSRHLAAAVAAHSAAAMSAAARKAQQSSSPSDAATAASGATMARWDAAVEALMSSSAAGPDSAAQAQANALRLVADMPSDVAQGVVTKCAGLQRYSDDAVAAGFPALCDAARLSNSDPAQVSDVLQRTMNRGGYVSAQWSGPLLRLLNASAAHRSASGPSGVLVQWSWMQHTQANSCPIARTAVVEAIANEQTFTRAKAEERSMREDDVLLREEGLLAMLKVWPASSWIDALSTVHHWRHTHTLLGNQPQYNAEGTSEAAASVQASPSATRSQFDPHDTGVPTVQTIFALVRVLVTVRRYGLATRALARSIPLTPEGKLAMPLTVRDMIDAMAAIIPSVTQSDGAERDAKEVALLQALLEAGSNVVSSPSTNFTEPGVTELAGLTAASAAVLKERPQLKFLGHSMADQGVTQEQFESVLEALVAPLRGGVWQVGKLAVAELARATKLEPPTSIESRLMTMHQSVEDDKSAVLDAFLGAE